MKYSIKNSIGNSMVSFCDQYNSTLYKFLEKICKYWLSNNVIDYDKILFYDYGLRGGKIHLKSHPESVLLLLKWIWNSHDFIAE